MTIRELCEKEVVQLEQGVCLGRADDLTFDPATARLQSLILLGRPRLFGPRRDHPAGIRLVDTTDCLPSGKHRRGTGHQFLYQSSHPA